MSGKLWENYLEKHFHGEWFQKLRHALKGMVSKSSNLFESLNIRYFGPIDGHNITKLDRYFKRSERYSRPKIIAHKNRKRKRI